MTREFPFSPRTKTQSVFDPPPSTPSTSCPVFSFIRNSEQLRGVFPRLFNHPVVVRSMRKLRRGGFVEQKCHIRMELQSGSADRRRDGPLDRFCNRVRFRVRSE